MSRSLRVFLGLFLAFGTGCPDDTPAEDTGTPDAIVRDTGLDASRMDALAPDTGDEDDAGEPDAGDQTAPTVDITAPADMSRATGTITVDVAATDDLGVTRVALFAAGNPAGEDQTAPYSFTFDTRTVPDGTLTLIARAYDEAGNEGSDTITLIVDNSGLPPDPATVAPPIDRTQPRNAIFETDFLFTNNPPIQTGVNPNDIDPLRRAVLRGRVLDPNANVLPGVTITIHDHAEFGQTLSRTDGRFDLAVNGGGKLTVDYQKAGYLPARRDVHVPWRTFVEVDDVILIPLDTAVTSIDLSQPDQIARGSVVTDASGTRRATLIFCPGSTAEFELASGGAVTRTMIDVRATEYTAGDRGPVMMPAQLPKNSAYTYALELSVDEALSMGATSVSFDCAPSLYVENFLGFPVGERVPSGYYDRGEACWIAEDDGRVIKIVAITGGLAELDADGDGLADDPIALGELGFDDDERRALATVYAVDDELWRVELERFSPHDLNWPFGPPLDARPVSTATISSPPRIDDPCEGDGSTIELQNGILGEKIAVAGTPFALHYRSDRTLGWTPGHEVRLTDPVLPASLLSVNLRVFVAGTGFAQSFTPTASLIHRVNWDRRDAYGRLVQGAQPMRVVIDHVYPAQYQGFSAAQRAFAQYGAYGLSINSRDEYVFTRSIEGVFEANYDQRGLGLGGWSLDVHHVYDTTSKTIYLGNGRRRAAENLNDAAVLIAGGGDDTTGNIGDNGPARSSLVYQPEGLAFDPQGNLYFTDTDDAQNRLRKIDRAGIVTTIAGGNDCDETSTDCTAGDGGPANMAQLGWPRDVAIDEHGNIFLVDAVNHRVRRIDEDGIITTIAGTGVSGYAGGGFSGDGGPAELAELKFPSGIAVGPDCAIYIADTENHVIRKIGLDGNIETIAGQPGMFGFAGDDGPAVSARFDLPRDVEVDTDGTLYIADSGNRVIRRIGTDGIITTIAGSGGFGSDDGDALSASFRVPVKLAIGPDSSIYIADKENGRIRRYTHDGLVSTVIDTRNALVFGKSYDAPSGVAVSKNGAIYVADLEDNRIFRVEPPLPGFEDSDLAIASEDGMQLHRFDKFGRHLSTLHALTGATLYTFGYDSENRLETITDADGKITRITHSAGAPSSIVGPFGHTTMLAVNADGYLSSVTNPAAETHAIGYQGDNGLMTSFARPGGASSTMTYDAEGRLLSDLHASGRLTELTVARLPGTNSYQTTVRSAENRTSSLVVDAEPGRGPNLLVRRTDGTELGLTVDDDNQYLSYPDGTAVDVQLRGDPRFGMQAPRVYRYTVNSGLIFNNTYSTRVVELADPSNLLSLVTISDLIVRSDGDEVRSFDASTLTWTRDSHAGRRYVDVLDPAGRLIERDEPGQATLELAYNPLGQLAALTRAADATVRSYSFTYDAAGHLATITDPLSRMFQLSSDAIGRTTRIVLPDGRQIDYAYDARGNLTSLTPPGSMAHLMSYDTNDQTEVYTPPSPGMGSWATSYAYNLDGDLTRVSLPGGMTIDYSYDPGARLQEVTYDRGVISYSYDAAGHISSIVAPSGVTITRDWDGAMMTAETWSGAVQGSVEHAYNSNFLVQSRSVNAGAPIIYSYDVDRLITGAGAMSLSRNATEGWVDSTTLLNVVDTHVHDGFGQLTSYDVSYTMGGTLYSVAYVRDTLGRVTRKDERVGGTMTRYDYTYDLLGRLATVSVDGAVTRTYSYDANGNRTGDGTSTGTYDAQDRLISWGNATYSYTDRGTLAGRTRGGTETTTYDYDALGNLHSVTLPSGIDIDYVIDGAGRRIGKRVGGSLVRGFLYQNQFQPIAELNDANGVTSTFVYATKKHVPDYMVRLGVTYRLISDELGSVRLVVNASNGTFLQRIDYGPYGEVLNDTTPGFQPFGFAGGIYDPDTRLVRFGRRDYDAETGRWTDKDPLRFAGGELNLYGYAGFDPINKIDSTGLCPPCIYIGAAAVVLGAAYLIKKGLEAETTFVANSDFGVRSFDPLDANAGDEYVAEAPLRARCNAAVGGTVEAVALASSVPNAPEEFAAGAAVGTAAEVATSQPGDPPNIFTRLKNFFSGD